MVLKKDEFINLYIKAKIAEYNGHVIKTELATWNVAAGLYWETTEKLVFEFENLRICLMGRMFKGDFYEKKSN